MFTTLKIKKTDVGTSFVQFFAYVEDQGYRVQAKTKGCNLVGVIPRRMLKFEAYSPSDNPKALSKTSKLLLS